MKISEGEMMNLFVSTEKLVTRVSVCVAVVFTIGCTAFEAPRQDTGVESLVPKGWVAGGTSRVSNNVAWWRAFRDKQLDGYVVEAMRANHNLKAAAGRVETARANARAAHAALVPTLGLGVDGARAQTLGPLGTTRNNSFGVSLNTSWEIDLWGRVRKGASAGYANLQASEADYAARALSLAGQTAKAWFALTEARLQLDLAKRTANSFRQTSRQATDRADVGIQSPSDKHLARANYNSALALVQQREEAVQRATRQMEVLLGRYPSGKLRGAAALPRLPGPVKAGLPATLVTRRPDLRSLERSVAALDRTLAADRASLYPSLRITGNGGYSSGKFSDLLDGKFGVWTIAGNVVQPVFQGGQLRAQIAASKGRLKEVQEQFAQAALNAYAEVETALALEAVLAKREASLRSTAEAARQADRVSNNRYRQGVATLLVVLESQRRLLDAESALISARRARLDNRIDLHLALGGGF